MPQVILKKVKIFEEAENSQLANYTEVEPRAAVLQRDTKPTPPVDNSRQQEQAAKSPVPEGVEYVAGKYQQDVLPAMSKRVVENENNDKKQEELGSVKQHDLTTKSWGTGNFADARTVGF